MTKSDNTRATSSPKTAKKKVSKKKVTAKKATTKKVVKKAAPKKTVAKKAPVKKAAPAQQKKSTISADEKRMMIAVHAYYKWQKAGFPTGDDYNHWLEAEREIEDMLEK
ncbi:MAG: DUF2934 domain-containing protein [Gammaproteobacteria bacterium]|jgi:hypothetical protein